MIEILIDNRPIEVDQSNDIAISFSIADIKQPDSSSSGYSKTIDVPITAQNMISLGFANEVLNPEQFNAQKHSAEIIVDGCTVMCGVASIEKISQSYLNSKSQSTGTFSLSIVGSTFEWVSSAKSPMNELVFDGIESGEEVNYSIGDVYRNSVVTTPTTIKFFPVDRGAFYTVNPNDEYIAREYMSIKDYHPFLNAWKTMQLIMGDYTVVSSMESELKKLYFPGIIPDIEDQSYIQEDNDFLLGTTPYDKTLSYYHSQIAPFWVTLFDLDTETEDGDYFVATDGVIISIGAGNRAFVPTASTQCSFEIKLAFETTITDAGAYINKFLFGPNREEFLFTPLDDTDAIVEGHIGVFTNEVAIYEDDYAFDNPRHLDRSYYLCFNFQQPEQFDAVYFACKGYKMVQDPEDQDRHVRVEWEEYVHYKLLSNEQNQYIYFNGGNTINYTEEGFLEEAAVMLLSARGDLVDTSSLNTTLTIVECLTKDEAETQAAPTLSFQKTIETNVYKCTKGAPFPLYPFMASTLYDVDADVKLSVGVCEIKPIFDAGLVGGNYVTLAAIGGDREQLELLTSLRKMYNLMFYTNPISKQVFVEPRSNFYNLNDSSMVDWRSKIDYNHKIEIKEVGAEKGKSISLSYSSGNDVVKYYNWKNNTELGSATIDLVNQTSNDDTEIETSFAPFLTREVESVGMILLQEQRDSEQQIISEADPNITNVIGAFAGVENRNNGIDAQRLPKYPLLAFQDFENNINLSYDDLVSGSTTLRGLRQYFDPNVSAYNRGREITIYIKLEPHDMDAILHPQPEAFRDLRCVFILELGGEAIPCLLEEICDYNPKSGQSTKCRFLMDPTLAIQYTETQSETETNNAII